MLTRRLLHCATRHRARARSGVSLMELIVVLALLGIAAAAIGRIGAGQQGHYRDIAGRIRVRSALREGLALLAGELRAISPGGGDLYADEMRDASIAFRSNVGAFLLCAAAVPGTSTIDVVELGADPAMPGDDALRATPSSGDSLWLYTSGADIGGGDDGWRSFLITGVAAVRGTCAPGATAVDRDVFRLSLSGDVQTRTEAHAPVKLFRRVRYALYSASDGLSYLGYSDCRPLVRVPPCATVQPVTGPYARYSTADGGARSGLQFRYLDRDGRVTDDATAVAMIEVVLRARSVESGRFAKDAVERQTVGLRNVLR